MPLPAPADARPTIANRRRVYSRSLGIGLLTAGLIVAATNDFASAQPFTKNKNPNGGSNPPPNKGTGPFSPGGGGKGPNNPGGGGKGPNNPGGVIPGGGGKGPNNPGGVVIPGGKGPNNPGGGGVIIPGGGGKGPNPGGGSVVIPGGGGKGPFIPGGGKGPANPGGVVVGPGGGKGPFIPGGGKGPGNPGGAVVIPGGKGPFNPPGPGGIGKGPFNPPGPGGIGKGPFNPPGPGGIGKGPFNPPGPKGGPGAGPFVGRPGLRPGSIAGIVIGAAVVGSLLPPPPVYVNPPAVIVAPPPVVVGEPSPPVVVVEAPPEPAPPAGNTTALQITDLDRGPAARAGLQKGDIILKVDGVRTRTFNDLRTALTASKGKSQFVFFNPDSGSVDARDVAVADGLIGASVLEIPVTLEEEEEQAAPAGQTALQVTAVERGGAGRAGILVGDVILGIDGKWVTSEADLAVALKASKGESEIVIFNPDTGKAETRKVNVQNGSIGATVKSVPVQIQS